MLEYRLVENRDRPLNSYHNNIMREVNMNISLKYNEIRWKLVCFGEILDNETKMNCQWYWNLLQERNFMKITTNFVPCIPVRELIKTRSVVTGFHIVSPTVPVWKFSRIGRMQWILMNLSAIIVGIYNPFFVSFRYPKRDKFWKFFI